MAKTYDWEKIELDYRANIKTLRQMGEEYGLSHVAITKRAKRDGWVRDLASKIQAKADELVTKSLVSKTVTKTGQIAEKALIEANADAVAAVRLGHRKDFLRARSLTNMMLDQLEAESRPEAADLLERLGELMASPDDSGRDRLGESYQAAISLPERAKTLKALVESMTKVVDMERTAFGMDAKASDEREQAMKAMTDAERAVRMAKLLGDKAPLLLAAMKKVGND